MIYSHFFNLLSQCGDAVLNKNSHDDEGELGRLEIINGNQGLEVHTYFCDMKTYPPDVELTFTDPNYDAIDKMLDLVSSGNLQRGAQALSKYTCELNVPTVYVKKTLTRRMADIEYPFLHKLKEDKINFALLNPNRGTIKRAQDVFKTYILPIYVTGDANEYSEYMNDVSMMNEAGWPVIETSVSQLPRQLYYAGFTARKYVNRLDVIGYEMNPRNFVSSYDDYYNVTTNEEGDGDIIEVRRTKGYIFKEEYFYLPDYYRYCSDYVDAKLSGRNGYYARNYPFLYNVISTNPIIGWQSEEIRGRDIKSVIGFAMRDGVMCGPYDQYFYEPIVQEFTMVGKEVLPIQVVGKDKYLSHKEIEEGSWYVDADPYTYHLSKLEKLILIEPRENVGEGVINARGIFSQNPNNTDIGVVKKEGVRYVYEGMSPISVWKKYNVDISLERRIRYVKNKFQCIKSDVDFDLCEFVPLKYKYKKKKVRPYPPIRVSRSPDKYYKQGDVCHDNQGKVVSLYKQIERETWTNGQYTVSNLPHYKMIRVEKGPITYNEESYVPLITSGKTLTAWREYMKKYTYLHYYTSHEYKIMRFVGDDLI